MCVLCRKQVFITDTDSHSCGCCGRNDCYLHNDAHLPYLCLCDMQLSRMAAVLLNIAHESQRIITKQQATVCTHQ